MSIPSFDKVRDVIPPYLGSPTQRADVGPYSCTIEELVRFYGVSPERRKILKGFCEFRKLLLSMGIRGKQWINGSFSENVEERLGRSPKDIDIVTLVEDLSSIGLAELIYGPSFPFNDVEATLEILRGSASWNLAGDHEGVSIELGPIEVDTQLLDVILKRLEQESEFEQQFDSLEHFVFDLFLSGNVDRLARIARLIFRVDHYWIPLKFDPKTAWALVNDLTYWYGLFSHRRGDACWKGMLCVALKDLGEETEALAVLEEMS